MPSGFKVLRFRVYGVGLGESKIHHGHEKDPCWFFLLIPRGTEEEAEVQIVGLCSLVQACSPPWRPAGSGLSEAVVYENRKLPFSPPK